VPNFSHGQQEWKTFEDQERIALLVALGLHQVATPHFRFQQKEVLVMPMISGNRKKTKNPSIEALQVAQ
jgi:hypothetical protein